MKTKLFFVLIFLLKFSIANSQTEVLQRYPENQMPYAGGYIGYYKDLHDIVVEKKLQPCSNKNEIYQFSLLIKPDSSIQFIRDLNPKVVESNKCAYDLAREVANKYQNGWKPASLNGIAQNAVARFIIFPDDFFNNYREGYYPLFSAPVYNNYGKDNIDRFRKELIAKLDLRRFSWNDIFTVETEFTITKDGKLEDIILTKKTGLDEFDRMIVLTFKGMKKNGRPLLSMDSQ
ncbi:hypothetical protein [Epilithonimonas sp.]|uniref:energy transducer TonB n=1 Tax=Epilithonimonas sp. TaxID=2894511 RepID=UPI00289D390E|nr:hypothetical protein [Epilithonimonas sp.]